MKNYPAVVLFRQPYRTAMTDGAYLIAVKLSARRVSARAGRWVNREGPVRAFDSKALAQEWARACSGAAATVWVQDAPGWADGAADGYLVGCRHGDENTATRGQQSTLVTE